MKTIISKLINIIPYPIKKETILFFFLYLLGLITLYITPSTPYLPFYLKLYGQLFFDTYIVCLIVGIMPEKIHTIALCITYIIAYLLALIDTFCVIKLDTPITTTIVQLISETNSSEASGFFSMYIDSSLLISPIGAIALILIINILTICISKKKKIRIKKTYQIFFDLIISLLLFISVH